MSLAIPTPYVTGSIVSLFLLPLFLFWSFRNKKSWEHTGSVEWQGEEKKVRRKHELDFLLCLRSSKTAGLSYDKKSQRGGNRNTTVRNRTSGTAKTDLWFSRTIILLSIIKVLTSIYGSLNLCWSQVGLSHTAPALLDDSFWMFWIQNKFIWFVFKWAPSSFAQQPKVCMKRNVSNTVIVGWINLET